MSVCDGWLVETVGLAEDLRGVVAAVPRIRKSELHLYSSICIPSPKEHHVPTEYPDRRRIRPLHMLEALLPSQ